MCDDLSSQKKYAQRESPPYKAGKCPGKVMKGNDGKNYVSEKRGNSKSYRWYLSADQKTSSRKSSRKKSSRRRSRSRSRSRKSSRRRSRSRKKSLRRSSSGSGRNYRNLVVDAKKADTVQWDESQPVWQMSLADHPHSSVRALKGFKVYVKGMDFVVKKGPVKESFVVLFDFSGDGDNDRLDILGLRKASKKKTTYDVAKVPITVGDTLKRQTGPEDELYGEDFGGLVPNYIGVLAGEAGSKDVAMVASMFERPTPLPLVAIWSNDAQSLNLLLNQKNNEIIAIIP